MKIMILVLAERVAILAETNDKLVKELVSWEMGTGANNIYHELQNEKSRRQGAEAFIRRQNDNLDRCTETIGQLRVTERNDKAEIDRLRSQIE